MAKPFCSTTLQKINSVSPSFCLAKWLQVTVDLVNGSTHSCHHPQKHTVPLDELKKNPGALHNTEHKKQQRKLMLEGKRPSECSYCWDMEDVGNSYSDRYIKSTDPWAWPDMERVAALPWDQDINPRYLEVMIDKVCSFSCSYCAADVSSSIAAEIKKFGPFPVSTNPHHRIPRADWADREQHRKTFVAAFESWLPKILPDLKVLRITGGEPLLSPEFWRLLSSLKTSGSEALDFAVNSHMNHRPEIIEKFCSQINDLLQGKKIRSFSLYTSLDTKGQQAEYIRHGLDYDKVLFNLETLISRLPETEVVVMCTFNILSIPSFEEFLDDIIEFKKIHPRFILDISYLKNPEYLRADLIDQNGRDQLKRTLEKMRLEKSFFGAHETGKLENLVAWVESQSEKHKQLERRIDFGKFVDEYDRRKNLHFLETFPELRPFYTLCKSLALMNQGAGL